MLWKNPLLSAEEDLDCLFAVFVTDVQILHSLFFLMIFFVISTIINIRSNTNIINSVRHGVIPSTSVALSVRALSAAPFPVSSDYRSQVMVT